MCLLENQIHINVIYIGRWSSFKQLYIIKSDKFPEKYKVFIVAIRNHYGDGCKLHQNEEIKFLPFYPKFVKVCFQYYKVLIRSHFEMYS